MISNFSKTQLIISRIMSGIVILFMLADSLFKFIKPEPVIEGTLELGYAEHHILIIGILGLLATIVYAIPSTAVLGAVLLTGYFGGAIATHIRLDNPLFSHTLFPVYLAVLAWGGLWLRSKQLQTLMPFKKRDQS